MKKLAAGVDLGGTNTVFGLVDEEGNIHIEKSMRTGDYPVFEVFAKELCDKIARAVEEVPGGAELIAIGIGAPCGNAGKGTIEDASNIKWGEGVPVVETIKKYYPDLPVSITNDANAAAIGEMVFGGAKGMSNFVVVTLGTGVGSGFVANGKLIYGHDSLAGELGHITLHYSDRECGCGRKGCLEAYASASGIKRTVFKLLADSMEPSAFRGISFDDLTPEMITQAALKGDKLAIHAFEHTGEALGQALGNAVAITSPEAIFLFGGLAKAGKYILEPTFRHMENSMLPFYRGKVRLLLSALEGKNAAVLGASALGWNELTSQQSKD